MQRIRFDDLGQCRMIISALSIALLGYAGGMVMAFPGVILGQWEVQKSNISLTTAESSLFASIAQLVAIPGSVLAGFLMERMGPRKLVLFSLPLSALAWILINQVVQIPWCLITCRAFQGLINTFICVVGCVYPCEIADVERRNFLGSVIDASFSLGFLATYLVGGIVKWERMSYVIICITVIPCYIGAYFAPESPIWLAHHGQFARAVDELKSIRSKMVDVKKELMLGEERAQEDRHLSMIKRIQLLGKMRYFLPVSAAVMLLILKEASGQFVVVLFIFQIFQKVDSSISSYWCSLIVGSTRLVSNLMCCFLLSKIPRRILLGTTSVLAAFSLGLLGTYFYLDSWNTRFNLRLLPLVLLVMFVVCYGIGIGPTSWLLAAEIQPSAVRSLGSGLAQAGFNIVQWLVAGSFVTSEKSLGLHTCFWIYAGGCLSITLFTAFLPETKGKTLTENEEHWIRIEERWKQLTEKLTAEKGEGVQQNV